MPTGHVPTRVLVLAVGRQRRGRRPGKPTGAGAVQGCHRLLTTPRHTLAVPARELDLDILDEVEAIERQGVLFGQVGDAADWRVAAECDVCSMVIVDVQPGVEGLAAFGL